MADTNIQIKLSADGKQVRDEIKLIDRELSELGRDTKITGKVEMEDDGSNKGDTSSDKSKQSVRDRNKTLMLRELILVRRELQNFNREMKQQHTQNNQQDNTQNNQQKNDNQPPPQPNQNQNDQGNKNDQSDKNNNPTQSNDKLQSAIGKLAAAAALFSTFNSMANASQNRLSLAYKTYGSTLAFDDYNKAGKNAVRLGKPYGYDYEVTMAASSANMNMAGFKDLDSYNTDMNALLKSSKAWGLDPSSVASTSGNLTNMGAFKVGEQQKFANLLAQSIVENGMKGMENQQLSVLESIADNLAAKNTTVSQDTLVSGLNLYNALVGNNENLKGQRGASMATSMQDIAASGDSALDILAGYGTEYTGIKGKLELRQLSETDPQQYWQQVYEGLKQHMGDTPEALEALEYKIYQKTGSATQAKEMVQAVQSGHRYDTKGTKTGEVAEEARIENYNQDKVSTLEKSDITIREAKDDIGDAINDVKSVLLDIYNNMPDGARTVLTGGVMAGGALGGGLLAGKMLTRILGGAGAGVGAGGAGVGGLLSGLGSKFSGAGDWIGKNIGKSTPLLKRFGPAVTGAIGAYQTYDAYDKGDYKGASEKAGGTVGGIAGMIAGAEGGAMAGGAIGAAFGGAPAVPGAIIGGLIGGIGGAFGGDWVGEKIGGGIFDLFSDDKSNSSSGIQYPIDSNSTYYNNNNYGKLLYSEDELTEENTKAIKENTKALLNGNGSIITTDSMNSYSNNQMSDTSNSIANNESLFKKLGDYIGGLFGGGGKSKSKGGSFAVGHDYIPYDNYPALLHKGEWVLTKQEADNLRLGKDISRDVPDSWDVYDNLDLDELGNLLGVDIPEYNRITEDDSNAVVAAKQLAQQNAEKIPNLDKMIVGGGFGGFLNKKSDDLLSIVSDTFGELLGDTKNSDNTTEQIPEEEKENAESIPNSTVLETADNRISGSTTEGAGTPASYGSTQGQSVSSSSMQVNIFVQGTIDGMTSENQSQIVSAVVAKISQTSFQSQISNGFTRVPNS